MPIAAASEALVRHLRDRLGEAGALDGWDVEALTLRQVPEAKSGRGVALVLWRMQPDEPAGDDDPPTRIASKADPPEGGGLVLRYLLLTRGADGLAEQTMLGPCMALLDRHPVVEESGTPGAIAGSALVVTIERPPDEAYCKLAEACGDPPPLVVPYAVRNVRLLPPAAGRVPDAPATDAI
jgi:Pvc16 N-terminal domain